MDILAVSSLDGYMSFAQRNNGEEVFAVKKSENPAEDLPNFLDSNNAIIPSKDGIIGVCSGPGSFVGIRIAMSYVVGLSTFSGAELRAINKFEMLAIELKESFPTIAQGEVFLTVKVGQDFFCILCKNGELVDQAFSIKLMIGKKATFFGLNVKCSKDLNLSGSILGEALGSPRFMLKAIDKQIRNSHNSGFLPYYVKPFI